METSTECEERERMKAFWRQQEKKNPHTQSIFIDFSVKPKQKLLHSSICPPNERQIHSFSAKSIFIHLSRVNPNVPDHSQPGRPHKDPSFLHFAQQQWSSGLESFFQLHLHHGVQMFLGKLKSSCHCMPK